MSEPSLERAVELLSRAGSAEFERDIIRERTKAGLAAARARGRHGGRPRAVSPKKLAQLHALAADTATAIPDILDTLKISRATYYRYRKTQPAKERQGTSKGPDGVVA